MIFENINCSVCGMACDDLIVDVDNDKVTVENGCLMGNAKLQELVSENRIREPYIYGRPAKWDDAIKKSAEILKNAKRPLIFIGSETSTEAMHVAIEIAIHLGGVIDDCATICHGPTVMGSQDSGKPTCTLGEIKNRADLIICWGSNPTESHPRNLSTFTLFPKGYFTKKGRNDRRLVVVDPRRTKTAEIADLYVKIKPGYDYVVFNALTAVLLGEDIDESIGAMTGVSKEQVLTLAEMMKSANFGVILAGLGVASSPKKNNNVRAVERLVKELNRFTKFSILANRGHANVAGFNQVCTWMTGFPYGVDFSRGYSYFNPGETTTVDILRRGEVDAVMVIGSALASHLPRTVVEYMAKQPIITIDISNCPMTMISDVVLPGVMDGAECEGTFYRMDDIPLRARKFIDPPFDYTTSNEDTLKQIFEEIKR
ncbi:MAG TPA: formylmethanofuran dehydrogenase subunit B [Halobacteria archaeon]|nr:formylmethanofuran dehydrogenase subunit B [Halobacteria archaeon]